jgi:hypothetical protein
MTQCWEQNAAKRPEFQSILIRLSKLYLKTKSAAKQEETKEGTRERTESITKISEKTKSAFLRSSSNPLVSGADSPALQSRKAAAQRSGGKFAGFKDDMNPLITMGGSDRSRSTDAGVAAATNIATAAIASNLSRSSDQIKLNNSRSSGGLSGGGSGRSSGSGSSGNASSSSAGSSIKSSSNLDPNPVQHPKSRAPKSPTRQNPLYTLGQHGDDTELSCVYLRILSSSVRRIILLSPSPPPSLSVFSLSLLLLIPPPLSIPFSPFSSSLLLFPPSSFHPLSFYPSLSFSLSFPLSSLYLSPHRRSCSLAPCRVLFTGQRLRTVLR